MTLRVDLDDVAKNIGHTHSGTQYGVEASKAYAENLLGVDRAFFLTPYLFPFLENLNHLRLVDIGCGAACWGIHAAKYGASVEGIDLQPTMIEEGNAAIQKANLQNQIRLQLGDVAFLPYPDSYFQAAISVNVGCNLPCTFFDRERGHALGLGPHFSELARVLQPGKTALISVPDSLDVVFTNDSCSKEKIHEYIEKILQNFNNNIDKTTENIISTLNQLTSVNNATFILEDDQLSLVCNSNTLKPGQKIWRKLPGLTVANRAHLEEEYLREIKNARLSLTRTIKTHFNSEEQRIKFNQDHENKLCAQYVYHNPFAIFEVQKPVNTN